MNVNTEYHTFKIFMKTKNIFVILLLVNLMMFTDNDADAASSYGKALLEIMKVKPSTDAEMEDTFLEDRDTVVEFFPNDVKFLNMTLKDCIYHACKNNYDIEIASFDPPISDAEIKVEKSVFDPILNITGQTQDSETPSNSLLQLGLGSSLSDFSVDTQTLDAKAEKLWSTGATFTLDFNINQVHLDPSPFAFFNPFVDSYIEAKINQPLLRNAGIFYNRSNIYIARNNKKISLLQFKETAIRVINDVQRIYWELVKAIEDLKVRNKSLERAKDLLRKNRVQARVGTMAPIDVLEAEEGVAKQVEGVIIGENNVGNKEDELKQIMNFRRGSILSDASIIPLDRPPFEIKKVSLDESIQIAMKNRPELFVQGLDIANAKINVKQKRNQLLPKLDFEAGIRYTGLAANKGNSLDSTFSQDFQSEFFQVVLEVPLGNREARNNYSKAKLEATKSVLGRRKLEQSIVVEVRTAVRQIKTNIERVKASAKAKELAQERLEAEEKKFKVGRTTSLEVVRAQENLAIAEGRAINARVDYQVSLGNLEAVQGTIIEKNSIVIEEY
ncbi:MAG: TolC family protein [Candidatus Scalindua sp. AMX11]|nr:MAG: TolC family protein [Candidatus Scalindua sp.]RZV93891.1 MAG: TolC family protein [Candidatus Scalindua sp. SCAELEC01]TDE65511.1 MAG: TolC family protein [Candidatus Scalindua sp. AMX11]